MPDGNHCILHTFQHENGPPPNQLPFLVARFENHTTSIVGGQPTRNGTVLHAFGEEGDRQNPHVDPHAESRTHSIQELVDKSSHVFAIITMFKN